MGTKLSIDSKKKTRSSEKGKQTSQRIVAAARDILVNKGYENFVVRKIAKQAGVQPGNLQYYYPNKKELLRAVLEPELSRYKEAYDSTTEGAVATQGGIKSVVDFLFADIQEKSVANIWYTIWALAPQDPDIAEIMDAWYQQYLKRLTALIQSTNTNLTAQRAGHAASILTAVIDGMLAQIGYGKTRHEIHDGIEVTIKEMMQDLTR